MFSLRVDDEIELRLTLGDDVDEAYALVDRNRAYLREWMPWLDGTTSVAELAAYRDHVMAEMAAGRQYEGGIHVRGALAGRAGIRVDPGNRRGEIGYWLSQDVQGQGIVTRTAEALITAAFERLHLHRVEIRCAVDNTKSRAVPERLGLTLEGVRRDVEWLYDHWVDHAVYVTFADEWAGRKVRVPASNPA
jgi:ribosomal-protein-serine acetyltransferase